MRGAVGDLYETVAGQVIDRQQWFVDAPGSSLHRRQKVGQAGAPIERLPSIDVLDPGIGANRLEVEAGRQVDHVVEDVDQRDVDDLMWLGVEWAFRVVGGQVDHANGGRALRAGGRSGEDPQVDGQRVGGRGAA